MCPRSSQPLSQLDVLAVDCQATAAAPRGHLLEIGWGIVRAAVTNTRLIALPNGEHIPPPVARITGISEHMMRDAVEAHLAWRELSAQAAGLEPAGLVVEVARIVVHEGDEADSLAHLRDAHVLPAKTWLRFTFRPLKQIRPQRVTAMV